MLEIVGEIRFHGHILDVYDNLDEPLFMAVEVARMIDYSVGDTGKMLLVVNNNQKLTRTIFRSGQRRNVWFLTLDGLYEVLFQSRKPVARAFRSAVRQILNNLRREREMQAPEWFQELEQMSEYDYPDEDGFAMHILREDHGCGL